MTLRKFAVDNFADSVQRDIQIKIKKIKEEYLESPEGVKLIEEKINEYNHLVQLANNMADCIEDEYKDSGFYIQFKDKYFWYDVNKKAMALSDIEERSKGEVETSLFGYEWSKLGYINSKVLAILSTLDRDMAYDSILKTVYSYLDLKAILLDKNI